MKIRELFLRDIERRVNPVVQVEDADAQEVLAEVNEYVVTTEIARQFERIIEEHYLDKNARDTAIWISGFYGSGKSLFLKLLSKILGQESVAGETVIDKLLNLSDNADFQRALRAAGNSKAAKVIVLHMKSEAFRNAGIVDILWPHLHQTFGYSRTPWVAEMERSLDRSGLRDAFTSQVEQNEGQPWSVVRDDPMVAAVVLARALSEIDDHFSSLEAAERAIGDIKEASRREMTPAAFAKRCLELLNAHPEYSRLFLGLDEMGQFAAGDAKLLLELQSVVEQFQKEGKGKLWIAATAQEKLDDVVENYGALRDQVAKIRDRFPKNLRVVLTSQNAEEVVRERLLRKASAQEEALRDILKPKEPWLLTETALKGIKSDYPKPTVESTVASYPFLPEHFELITEFMQGLARDTGGTADRTARGPRALIGVTQEIAQNLADSDVGALVRADHVYQAMSGSVPSEDADLIAELQISAKDVGLARVVQATYVVDLIGPDRLLPTSQNISKLLIGDLDDNPVAIATQVEAGLAELTRRTYLREVGGGEGLGYRFLKPYQRKIEDDVRQQNPSRHELQLRAQTVIKEALAQFIGQRVTFKGVRSFSVGSVVDGAFALDSDIVLKILSPISDVSQRDAARDQSISDKQPYWVMGPFESFLDEIKWLVAIGTVLDQRRSKMTTEEERSQIRRAEEDRGARELRLAGQAVAALRAGKLFVEGLEVPIQSKMDEAILTTVVENKYPYLGRAAVLLSEKDIDAVFSASKPGTGPLAELGLVKHGKLVDTSEIVQSVIGTVKHLTFKASASGDAIAKELEKAPYGYATMQTRVALATLCALGKMRALAPGHVTLIVSNGLVDRLRSANDFKKLVFEPEKTPDPATLRAAADLLQQRFGRKVPAEELPAIAAAWRNEVTSLATRIALIENLARIVLPSVTIHLSALKAAVEAVGAVTSDALLIERVAENQLPFETWEATLKPLEDQLTPEAIEAIRRARQLISDAGVVGLNSSSAEHLEKLLSGPRPWQDLAQIKNARSEIGAAAAKKLAELHVTLRDQATEANRNVDELSAKIGATKAEHLRGLSEVQELDCKGFVDTGSGLCSTCKSGVSQIKDRIDAFPARVSRILTSIRPAGKDANGGPQPPPISFGKRITLPRVITTHAELQPFAELLIELEKVIDEQGSVTIVP